MNCQSWEGCVSWFLRAESHKSYQLWSFPCSFQEGGCDINKDFLLTVPPSHSMVRSPCPSPICLLPLIPFILYHLTVLCQFSYVSFSLSQSNIPPHRGTRDSNVAQWHPVWGTTIRNTAEHLWCTDSFGRYLREEGCSSLEPLPALTVVMMWNTHEKPFTVA